MTIFICHNASDRIRGELTRFLFEIDSGVYIGNISAEVRNILFNKIKNLATTLSDFRLLMIYSYKNEHGFLYEYLNYKDYTLIDFDGLLLPVFLKK